MWPSQPARKKGNHTSNPKCIRFVDDNPRETELARDEFNQYHAVIEIVALRDAAEEIDHLCPRGEFAGCEIGFRNSND
jgi:hypothetical protein